jgi:hypothetical protein
VGNQLNQQLQKERQLQDYESAEAPLGALLFGLVEKAERRKADRNLKEGLINEDFILRHLPSDITLYSPVDIIQAAKDFYQRRGLSVVRHHVKYEGFFETLDFEGEEQGGMVQLDLDNGYHPELPHGKWPYELWVTAMFSPRNKTEKKEE